MKHHLLAAEVLERERDSVLARWKRQRGRGRADRERRRRGREQQSESKSRHSEHLSTINLP